MYKFVFYKIQFKETYLVTEYLRHIYICIADEGGREGFMSIGISTKY
jgi:hypothetical protein